MRDAVKDQAEVIAISYRGPHGFDLWLGSGDGEGVRAICRRPMFRVVRAAASGGALVYSKTTTYSPARIPMRCSPTITGRGDSDRIQEAVGKTFRMGNDLFRDYRRGAAGVHRDRARHFRPMFSSHDDVRGCESAGLGMGTRVSAFESGVDEGPVLERLQSAFRAFQ